MEEQLDNVTAEGKIIPPNRITYWEERSVNAGDYEGVKMGLTHSYKFVENHNGDAIVKLRESERFEFPQHKFSEAVKKVMLRVKKTLDVREEQVRRGAEGFVDFNTLKKGRSLGSIKKALPKKVKSSLRDNGETSYSEDDDEVFLEK